MGLGLNIPIVYFITCLLSYRRSLKGEDQPWDSEYGRWIPVYRQERSAGATAAIAAAVTARRTLRLRTGHVHRKHLAFELAAVDPVDGFLPLAVIGHLDEPESAGTPRLPIGNHICRRYFAELCK